MQLHDDGEKIEKQINERKQENEVQNEIQNQKRFEMNNEELERIGNWLLGWLSKNIALIVFKNYIVIENEKIRLQQHSRT